MSVSFTKELHRYLDMGMTLQYQRNEATSNTIAVQKECPVYYKRTHGTRSVDQPLFNDGLGQLRI